MTLRDRGYPAQAADGDRNVRVCVRRTGEDGSPRPDGAVLQQGQTMVSPCAERRNCAEANDPIRRLDVPGAVDRADDDRPGGGHRDSRGVDA